MKGMPTVKWTCDRCGETTTTEPHVVPTQWWQWKCESLEQNRPVEPTYEVCDRCDSAVREFIKTPPEDDQPRGLGRVAQ